MTIYKDLSGTRFGNLIVLRVAERPFASSQIEYICECQCENKTIIRTRSSYLRCGKKDNCGCLTKQKQSDAKKKYNTYDLSGEYGIGYTTKNEEFYFDLEDYEKIKDYCWMLHRSSNKFYVESRSIHEENKIIKMHRLVMNVYKRSDIIDHISRETNDNRKSNLRIITNELNARNRGECTRNTSGVNGVSFRKDSKKWRSRIRENGVEKSVGEFNNLLDAAIARMEAEKRVYGKYRRNDWEEKLRSISSSL